MRTIAVFTGSRAEYGILKPVLTAITADKSLKLALIVTGTHLLAEFGNTKKEIEKDGFPITACVPCVPSTDTKDAVSLAIGQGIIGFTHALLDIQPDIALVPCDRFEMLAAAIACYYMDIPIAHLHGGERSQRHDDSARHAITKLAHIHLVASAESGERLKKLGEDDFRIHVVGAPGLDTALHATLPTLEETSKTLRIDIKKPYLLVVQHPTDPDTAPAEMKETMDAINVMNMTTIIIHPNIDAGGRSMTKTISANTSPHIHAFESIPHTTYLSLLKHTECLIGNSSSGIIEAPSFHTPVVNIGNREEGRERSTNIIDVPPKKEKIIAGINKALSPEFKRTAMMCKNPYGDGHAGERIAKIISDLNIDEALLKKTIVY